MQIIIPTKRKREIVDITHEINQVIESRGTTSGVVTLVALHTTAALTIADLDPGTDQDFLNFLEAITPPLTYRHPHDPEHAPDHILASIIGPSLSLVIEDGQVVLGVWQRIVLVELDGPRDRQIIVSLS